MYNKRGVLVHFGPIFALVAGMACISFGRDYSGDALTIKEAKLTDNGMVQITFTTMPETVWYCPGANGKVTKDGIELKFVRSWFKWKPKVHYPAKPVKKNNHLEQRILINAKGKPLFIRSGKKWIKIFPKDEWPRQRKP